MTEQEWDERDYNQQRGGCPLFAATLALALAGLVTFLIGRRR